MAAPVAGAAARFASPGGSGTECTQANPCDIVTAVNDASEGDDVTIGTGTYGAPTPLATELEDEGEPISIHGQAGQPRPVIHTQAEYGVELLAPGSSLSDVDIENAVGHFGVYVNEIGAANVDHVISHVSAAGAIACYPSGTLTDSVCWSSGTNGIAETVLVASSVTATLRNDTLIASGAGGTAVAVNSSTDSTMTINLINSIARGAGTDIFAGTDSNPKTAAIVNADHSNYATVQVSNGGGGSTISVTPAGSGTNQQGAPAFVNAGAGDFRELAASTATIDRGENSDLDGSTDLDGNPRVLPGHLTCDPGPEGPAVTDIGAYELVPVAPPCPELVIGARITKTRVSGHGSSVRFEFKGFGTVSGFECRLQKTSSKRRGKRRARFSQCRSPKAYRHLKPGRYRFEVRAVSASGILSVPAVKKVTIGPPR
jgi:hypothetical protein